MKIFCSMECADMGSICDFCKHLHDYKGKNDYYDGYCKLKAINVNFDNGFNCDDFICYTIK